MKYCLFLAVILLSCFSLSALAQSKSKPKPPQKNLSQKKMEQKFRRQAFLDTEDEELVSVYEEKGLNWKNCKRPTCTKALAWPDNKSKIFVIGEIETASVVDPYSGERVTEEYYPVEVTYTREDAGGKEFKIAVKKAWVEASFLHFNEEEEKKDPFYKAELIKTPVTPPNLRDGPLSEECRPLISKKGLCHLPEVTQKVTEEVNKNREKNKKITYETDLIMESVGACVEKKPIEGKSSSHVNYDLFALDLIKKAPVPEIQREDTEFMTRNDLINIDALARTLYGEVASCFKKGLNHPMAVARIAINRANTDQSAYITGRHKTGKPTLAKMLTSDTQFNTWSDEHIDEKTKLPRSNPALENALCPQSKDAVWKNAVRIATEAVLYPKKFEERTAAVGDNVKNFTSRMDFSERYKKFKEVKPKIEGRALAKECVRLWEIPIPIKKKKI
ncbi:MAG: hypothetical protein AABY64_05800 [Bdellovibrionota bacterium]